MRQNFTFCMLKKHIKANLHFGIWDLIKTLLWQIRPLWKTDNNLHACMYTYLFNSKTDDNNIAGPDFYWTESKASHFSYSSFVCLPINLSLTGNWPCTKSSSSDNFMEIHACSCGFGGKRKRVHFIEWKREIPTTGKE